MIRRRAVLGFVLGLAACGRTGDDSSRSDLYPNETPQMRRRIEHYADYYDVPVSLVQRVILRESDHNAKARNGRYYGLMQIDHRTARTMGYRGHDDGLLDVDTNLKYGVKYLRGAWLVSDGDQDAAVGWYARGYYYEAKRKGLLEETGLRS
ncbi:MAG: lytic transglycosylase domain-containing protein [Rhodobacter sp.]|nr:lytic transglycosylase domain-containing protein [Rhodobacter sp.]